VGPVGLRLRGPASRKLILTARIAEAEREGWLGEGEGLKISLAGAEDNLAQIDRRTRPAPADLGRPAPVRQA